MNINEYKILNTPKKIEFFDNIDGLIRDIDWTKQENKKSFKKLLLNIFNNKDEDNYTRKRALETICNLTFSDVFRKGSTSDILLDICHKEDVFILNIAIKNLFYLHEVEELESIKKLENLCAHSNGDVCSEAYFRLGQIYFFKSNQENYSENIIKANKYFFKSKQEIENRKDAELFYLTSEILLGKSDIDSMLDEISNVIWDLISFDFNNKVDSLYFKIYDVVKILVELIKTNPKIFFEKEFNQLCSYHYELLSCELNNGIKNTILGIFKKNVKLNHIEPFYHQNLKSELARVKVLLYNSKTDEERSFWEYLLTLLNDDSKKKESNYVPMLLTRILPLVSIDKLQDDLKSIDPSNPRELLNYIIPHIEDNGNELKTGSNVGDDIFNSISSKLKKLCEDTYPHKRFLEFLRVLEDVIRYIVRTTEVQQSDNNFSFLFNPNALEKDLQRSMLNMFKLSSKKGSSYSEENHEFSDGGRVDIKYQSDNITIPLELKRTKSEITEDRIKKDYLSQAQTYTYNHDRFGFFILLDLVEKDKAKPMNNIRDLFGVVHLETQHRVNENHPDYVVWCIIPANKILPSSRSKYK